jgi:hypothetical protein
MMPIRDCLRLVSLSVSLLIFAGGASATGQTSPDVSPAGGTTMFPHDADGSWWLFGQVIRDLGAQEVLLALALVLISTGLWQVWRPGAWLVPGIVLLYIALPHERPSSRIAWTITRCAHVASARSIARRPVTTRDRMTISAASSMRGSRSRAATRADARAFTIGPRAASVDAGDTIVGRVASFYVANPQSSWRSQVA